MGIEFRPATMDGVGIFVAIAGASRSGKTYSALRAARGLAGPHGKIAAIDTESKRMSHYKRDFAFDVYNMGPPFRPERFVEASRRAEAGGYDVLVIDSFTSEWNGEGGILDWQQRELDRLAGDDEVQRLKKNGTSWIAPKRAHTAMMTAFLQLKIPVIFCLRAKDKTDWSTGKPVKVGWVPTQDQTFLHEWTVAMTLHPDTPGQMRYDLPHKVTKDHKQLLPDRGLITEAFGEGLYAWAHSDSGQTAPFASRPEAPAKQTAEERKAADFAAEMTAAVAMATDAPALRTALAQATTARKLDRLRDSYPELHDTLMVAVDVREREFEEQDG